MINGKVIQDKAAEEAIASISAGSLPSQTGNSGKFLTTNGTAASWATVSSSLPTQSGNSGKFLTTEGTDASWAAISGSSLGTGYDATKTQTLKNVEGVLTWVDDVAAL